MKKSEFCRIDRYMVERTKAPIEGYKKKEIERIQERFPNGIKNATTQEILETFGINCEKDADGFLTIDQFRNPDFNITYSDLGINVNKLLKDIKAVKGSLYVDNNISTLGNIEHIGGNAIINSASITDLGNLRTVDGSMNLSGRNIKSLGKLENVGGSVHFFDNKDLENQYIKLLKNKLPNDLDNAPATEIFDKLSIKYHIDTDGMLILENFKLLSDSFTYADLGIKVEKLLESVKAIKGTAHFNNLKLKNIGNVTSIGTAYFDGAEIETLGKLKTVNGDFDAYSDSSKIKSIGELDFIGSFSCFANKKLEREFIKNVKNKFPNGVKKATPQEILEAFHIKYKVDNDGLLIISHFKTPSIELSKFGIDINKLFNHIKKIEGDARFSDYNLKSLGMLESIGGNAIFENTKLKKLKKLKSIGGEAEFGSYVKKLGDLEFIGGDVIYHDDSKLKLSDFENITVLGKVN